MLTDPPTTADSTPAPDRPVRVLIVDDDPFTREPVATILNLRPEIEVIGAVDGGAAAVAFVRHTRPDIVLMDLQMPGMDGIEATRQVLAEVKTRVVALTTMVDLDTVLRVFDAGGDGYILKGDGPVTLVEDVLAAARGDAILPPRYARAVIERSTSAGGSDQRREALARLDLLTERERATARLVATGGTNAEIAAAMHVSESTMKTHLTQALAKLGLDNRMQLGILVDRAGETPPPAP
ncbi:response regulator [Microbacterium paludicola]|uniref:response regulator n=1 Tax=Microbacterium paludicola TaxID=300019 RepID=UPI0038794E8F